MKRIISNIALFAVSITLFCYVYVGLFKVSRTAICVLLVFLAAYGACMGLSWKSMKKLKKLEQKLIHFGLDRKDRSEVLLFSLSTLVPTYFCVILVSLVPLYTYEIWFITVLPCVCLNCLPLSSVLSEYYSLTHKKAPFLIWFLLLTVECCLLGAFVSYWFIK